MTTRRAATALVLFLVSATAACVGSIGTVDEADTNGGGGGGGSGAGAGQIPVGDPPGGGADPNKTYAPLVPAPAGMLRLTRRQFENSVAAIFGATVSLRTPLEADETTELFSSIGAAKVGTSDRGVEQYQAAAIDIAAQVFQRRASYPALATCNPTRADDPCIDRAIRELGYRLWRRPVTDAEASRYRAIVAADGTAADKLLLGLQYAVAGLVASPNFIYVAYAGEPDAATGAHRFTSWEMASRLAYTLWDSTPDVALLSAAAAGSLVTADGLRAEVARMLAAPEARGLPARILGQAWNVAKLDLADKNQQVFPKWNGELLASFLREFELVLADAVFENPKDIRQVFTQKETFANATLGGFYGLPTRSTELVRQPLNTLRHGLLTSGAVLAANSPTDRSSPTHRGVFLLERVLCEEVPAPPPGVDTTLAPPSQARPTTTRERLEQHRQDPACAGCHALIDPLGFTLENYDGIGSYRTQENGQVIDATGKFEGRTLAGVVDLAATLAADKRVGTCMARHVFQYATAHETGPGEAGVLALLQDQFAAAGFGFRELLLATATSPGFRYFSPPTL